MQCDKSQANESNTKRVALPQEIESNILGRMAVLRCNMHTADSMTRMVTETEEGRGRVLRSCLAPWELRRCVSKVFAAKKLTALAHRFPNLNLPIRPLPL